MKTPWNDEAIVVKTALADGDREIAFQGSLWQAVEWLRPKSDRTGLSIWLPDRRVKPLSYDASEIEDLLRAVDRPRSAVGFA